MRLDELSKPYDVVCDNCFTRGVAYRDEFGMIKYRCKSCGCIITMRRVSNRHINKDIRAPK